MAEEIQKHQLLVKLLKMTTSSNDGEALTAMRKANDILASAGWDWERLMAGKITIVGDPFANLGDPTPRRTVSEPPRYAHVATPYRQAAGRGFPDFDNGAAVNNPPPRAMSPPIASTISNKFEGACYCCGILVAKLGGFIFKAKDYHTRAPDGWKVTCTTCNANRNVSIGPSPAQRQGRGARKVTADDIA